MDRWVRWRYETPLSYTMGDLCPETWPSGPLLLEVSIPNQCDPVALSSVIPILNISTGQGCFLLRNLQLSRQEQRYSKERRCAPAWLSDYWDSGPRGTGMFPRNLLLGNGKTVVLVFARGGFCHRIRLLIVRPQCGRAWSPDNGQSVISQNTLWTCLLSYAYPCPLLKPKTHITPYR